MTTPNAKLRALRPTARENFEIAIICALALEADAVAALFDHYWDEDGISFDKVPGDLNGYSTGVVGRHNVVLTHMAGMGKANAAIAANNCRISFPNIKLALVVGTTGVVPFGPDAEEIILGDVVISDGVIQYDLGRQLPGRFARKDTLLDALGRPSIEIRSMMARLKGLRGRKQLANSMTQYLDALRLVPELAAEYPGTAHDILFEATYRHIGKKEGCDQSGCSGSVVTRTRIHADSSPVPAIHFGLIASGDSVMKSGEDRDRIAKAEDVIAFEMEGAGVWTTLPCVVIKGACDYADSHKNKRWQRYAAATAAACMKAFLKTWAPSQVPQSSLTSQLKVYEAVGITDGTHLPCNHVQLAKNPRFTGRTSILNQLEQTFFENDCSQKVALVGLGGVGKTQIALHFAYNLKARRPEYSIFWVPLLSAESAEQAFGEIAKKLGLQQRNNDDDVKALVCQHLNSDRAGQWLFVIDNADDQNLVSGSMEKPGLEAFFPTSENGILLMTTRSGHVAEEFAGPDVIEVEQMDQKEATDLFRAHLTHKKQLQDEESVARLLSYLTFLPLAITQAASYLNQTKAPIKSYLTLLQEASKSLPSVLGREFKDTTRYKGFRNAVGKTWLVSFQQIEQSDEAAVRLLSFLSCIEPKAIPQAMIPDTGSEKTEWAVGTLCAYSFLVRQEGTDMFNMHSLVHMATQEWIKEQGWSDKAARNAVSHLVGSFPWNTHANHELRRKYVPHATRLLEQDIENRPSDTYRLYQLVGDCHSTDRRFKEAAKCYETVCWWKRGQLAEDDHDRLQAEHALARAYLDERRIKDAIKILEHVVAVWKGTLDEKDHSRVTSEHNLASAYLEDGRIQDAIEIFEHVVAVQKATLHETDHFRLVSEHELARAYVTDQRIEDAIKILEHVVAIQKQTLDETDHSRLASKHVLARAYLADGRVTDAIEILEHVVAIEKQTLDAKDHSRLASERELARAYRKRTLDTI